MAPKNVLDRGSGTPSNRFQLSDGSASPHNRKTLPPMLDGVQEIGEVASSVSGAHLGHEIRLSDTRTRACACPNAKVSRLAATNRFALLRSSVAPWTEVAGHEAFLRCTA